jgi:p-hydroxybenzoate 3-monooxygenase
VEETQVGIVGAGPAGLLLSHLLARAGVSSVVVEARDREYVEARVRAGVLEQGTVDLLTSAGVGERLTREGLVHHGVNLQFGRQRHRIDLSRLTGGKAVTVYGQQEVVKDLIAARLGDGGDLRFGASAVAVEDFSGALGSRRAQPRIRFRDGGGERELRCQVIAGCDGFHGVCRPSIPAGVLRTYDREFPFAWLGILAAVPPSTDELIYAFNDDGFALHSLRSPEISRLYLQVDPAADLADWPDDRIWGELQRRLATPGWTLHEGPVTERSITPMRSFVAEPMCHGRLFLAGDAAHIVPPTGAKGLNLAMADVGVLAAALIAWYRTGDAGALHAYSDTCARRVWRVQDFSTSMTTLLHAIPGADPFDRGVQRARQRYLATSTAAAAALAENYVGLAEC